MKKLIFMSLLGITVMLASCSQSEDMLQTGHTDAVTFTASLENGMSLRPAKTRGVTDPTDGTITRAVLEIYDEKNELVDHRIEGIINNDEISFTAQLERDKSYTCLFWADGGEGTYDIADLKAITRSTNPSIAYYAKEKITASDVALNVTLTHAVAKVVLQEISTLAKGDKVGIAFDMPVYTFNVEDGSYTKGEGETKISQTIDITEDDKTGVIASLYVFAPSTDADLVTMTLSYTAANALPGTLDVPSVPLKRNYRTVLQGAFGGIESTFVNQPFSVSLDKEWEGDENETFTPGIVITTAGGQITTNQLNDAFNARTDGKVIISGPLDDANLALISQWVRNRTGAAITLDLNTATGFTALPRQAFDRCGLLVSVILPPALEAIGEMAFMSSGLVEIDIPDGVTTFGEGAFNGCTSLKRVKLPKNLTTISDQMFSKCTSLTGITLPATVKTIGNSAFRNSGLKTIILPESVEYISQQAFACMFDYILFESTLPMNNSPQEGNIAIGTGVFSAGESGEAGSTLILLPNINTEEVAKTYYNNIKYSRPEARIYYKYNSGGNGDRTDTANYTEYTEPAQ